ncbi:glycerophosphodiester phosphodiesterase [Longimicrobium sp.]|jgi:glycerophosphoryl diester phosphodiesterase|uniref:glycerophosphodiester phosphodiesterase n=1 Tax=Longimicrobium sp. TaxID=2029185 RepID=UPI002ED9B515
MPLHPNRPLVLGHRGAPFQAPENTMRGFRLATAHGADGVELDVQPAADGTPVVIHDLSLDRTTDRTGAVAALSWPAIAQARAGGEPVPQLEEAAAWAAESGAWVNVEIKSPGAEAASVASMEAAGVMERTVFSSFVPEVIAELGRVAPHAVRYFLTERWDDEVRRTVHDLGAHGVCPHHSIATPSLLTELREAGLGVVVWTVDDPERIRELVRAGVDAVITNRPELGVAVLREERRKED